ncbi:claudin-7 [Alligator sinensis]|uniref:Claudin-7 n=1 Tax=Alligator sinensis TaxID=38654 RepID=A0A1U7SGK1_ALLSI|nr:claudin-7 [Alligator sinensis]
MGRGSEPRGVGSPVASAPPHPSPPCSPASLQATRALMVVAVVLGLVALGIAIMGMKCTRCGGDNKVQKARIAMTGGLVYVVAGLAGLVACSWYGHQIVTDFYNPLVPMNAKYEFGSGIFVGWAGSALTLLGGGLLSCSCPGKSGPRAQYPKSKAASSNREYV